MSKVNGFDAAVLAAAYADDDTFKSLIAQMKKDRKFMIEVIRIIDPIRIANKRVASRRPSTHSNLWLKAIHTADNLMLNSMGSCPPMYYSRERPNID